MKRQSRMGAIRTFLSVELVLLSMFLSAGVLVYALSELAFGAEPDPQLGSYEVKKGRADRGTYLGWKVFHSACYGCHGLDANGTDIAPSLVERVKLLTPREFAVKVLTRYRIAIPSTEALTKSGNAYLEAMVEEVLRAERAQRREIMMPASESDPNVQPRILDLYAYLSARADGVLVRDGPKSSVRSKGAVGPVRG
jgi:hypothetical protein